jgi:hypothetical protein
MNIDDNKQLSELISSQLPEFVRVDHPTLVAFLTAYYEWMDIRRDEGMLISPMSMRDVPDVDRTMDQFVAEFKKEYLFQFPESLAVSPETGKPVDERKLIKTIKQFYRAKGTEKAYEFLFRILYDTGVEFYYPKTDILRLSSGKWVQNNYLRVSNVIGDSIFRAAGNNIVQRDGSGILATARVVSVSVYQKGNFNVAELLISGRNGTFRTGAQYGFEFTDGDETFKENRIYSVVSSVNITDGGEGYRPGDRVVFEPVGSDAGQRAYGTVTQVDSAGTVQKVKIEDFGINYEVPPIVRINSVSGSGFVGTAVVGSLCSELGYYANNDGRLSSNKVIQDNHFYQNWSYVLKSEVVIDTYREAIRKLVHPVGTAMFGSVSVKRCTKNNLGQNVTIDSFSIPYIGNYLPYTFTTYDNLKDWFGDTGTAGYHPTVHDRLIQTVSSIDPPQIPGNPLSNGIGFVESTIGALGQTGVSGYTGAAYTRPVNPEEPYWFVYEHPNNNSSIANTKHIAKIWSDQLRGRCDFLSWREWTLNKEGTEEDRKEWELAMPTGVTGCCVGVDGQTILSYGGFTGTNRWRPDNSFKYAELVYGEDETEFRKLTARSFFEMGVGDKNFNCRTTQVQRGVFDVAPALNITSPKNGSSFSLTPDPEKDPAPSKEEILRIGGEKFQYRATLPIEYEIVNPQAMIDYPIAGVVGILDNGQKVYDYRLSGSLYFNDVESGKHTVTLKFFDNRKRMMDYLPSSRITLVYGLDTSKSGVLFPILSVGGQPISLSTSISEVLTAEV